MKQYHADYIKQTLESNTIKEFDLVRGYLITEADVTITFLPAKLVSSRIDSFGIPLINSYRYPDYSMLFYGYDKLEQKLKFYTTNY